jgi:hypothetical protein
VIYVTKLLDSRVYHMCPDCGRQFPSIVCYAGNQIKHSDEKNFLYGMRGKFKRKESYNST